MRKKIYPKMSRDTGGMKFFFNDGGRHYTLRFSGNPLFILEKAFFVLGGKDFNKVYKERDFTDKEDTAILKEAVAKTEETLAIIESVFKDGVSPFVIYADNFISELKEGKKD